MYKGVWEDTSSNSEESECREGYTSSCIVTPEGDEFPFCMSTLCSSLSEAECLPEKGCHWEDSSCVVNQWDPENRTCIA